MATTADIAKRYFTALAAHDLEEAIACWQLGAARAGHADPVTGDVRGQLERAAAATL